jgi:hypothetical protein
MREPIIIDNNQVRVDDKTGFVNLTDMARMKNAENASMLLKNWMRIRSSVRFFYEWELFRDPGFKSIEFDTFKSEAGDPDFFLTAKQLVNGGATGIFAKSGRYGGTYGHIDWAIHFANWMDPRSYVLTINAFRDMSDYFSGRNALHDRFSRELVAKNYGLITGQNKRQELPLPPHPMTEGFKSGDRKTMIRRYLNQVDADILNLAVFGITALEWRSKFPQADGRKNMRDFAIAEELLILNALQIELRVLQEDQYNPEEKLHRLRDKAGELIDFHCDTPEKVRDF